MKISGMSERFSSTGKCTRSLFRKKKLCNASSVFFAEWKTFKDLLDRY